MNFNAKKYIEKNIPKGYRNIYGTWLVTTDTDSGTNNLGIHKGYIDMIALNLAEQECYGLNFKPAPINEGKHLPTRSTVTVKFIEADLHHLNAQERVEVMKELFKDRTDISISESQYYGGFCIDLKNLELINERKRQIALSKLTPEERKLLGV